MNNEKWNYLKRQAEKTRSRFISCDGVIYEVEKNIYPTGQSPRYSIEPIRPVTIPPFRSDT